jgi:hypothetical protein
MMIGHETKPMEQRPRGFQTQPKESPARNSHQTHPRPPPTSSPGSHQKVRSGTSPFKKPPAPCPQKPRPKFSRKIGWKSHFIRSDTADPMPMNVISADHVGYLREIVDDE